MRHIRVISANPRTAQIEQINLIIGLITGVIGIFASLIALVDQANRVLGIEIPRKDADM